MTQSVQFFSVSSAVRSSQDKFFSVLERVSREWVAAATQDDIRSALFDTTDISLQINEKKAA